MTLPEPAGETPDPPRPVPPRVDAAVPSALADALPEWDLMPPPQQVLAFRVHS